MASIRYEVEANPSGGVVITIESVPQTLTEKRRFARFPLTHKQASELAAQLMVSTFPADNVISTGVRL